LCNCSTELRYSASHFKTRNICRGTGWRRIIAFALYYIRAIYTSSFYTYQYFIRRRLRR